MAREIVLRDDIDGSYNDVKPVVLSWNGNTVELDLSAANRAAVDTVLAPYLKAGRKQRRPSASAPIAHKGRPSKSEQAYRAAVRKWAKDEGLDVPSRGEIPEEIAGLYDAARKER